MEGKISAAGTANLVKINKKILPPNVDRWPDTAFHAAVYNHHVGAVSYKANEPMRWFNSEYERILREETIRYAVSLASPNLFSEDGAILDSVRPEDEDGSSD